MTHTWRAGLVALAVMAWHASPVLAQGDADAGRIKSSTCIGCHGISDYKNVYPTFRVPKLGGQHEAYIASSLKAYRSGQRSHPTMKAQAASMSDQDIADIAAFFANAPDEE